MRILIFESVDKTRRTIVDIDPECLETQLENDLGFVEVIPMTDPNSLVRIYFDIDEPNTSIDPLNSILELLCDRFNCAKEDWAIASAHRIDKLSYHIVSKIKSISIFDLREETKFLKSKHSAFDTKLLYFGIMDSYECGYFRLPNQSKQVLNKVAPPFKIQSGSIRDFFVTHHTVLLLSVYNAIANPA